MRNICNIDLENSTGWGSSNSAFSENEITVEIKPLPTQETGFQVEVTGSNGGAITTGEIQLRAGLIYYTIPFEYYSTAGDMKVRLLSAEGNSGQVVFHVPAALNSSDNVQVKFDFENGYFVISAITGGSTDLPIASTTRLGVIKVGENLTIESDGTLSSAGAQGPPGEDGKTPQLMINSDGHLIAIYDD